MKKRIFIIMFFAGLAIYSIIYPYLPRYTPPYIPLDEDSVIYFSAQLSVPRIESGTQVGVDAYYLTQSQPDFDKELFQQLMDILSTSSYKTDPTLKRGEQITDGNEQENTTITLTFTTKNEKQDVTYVTYLNDSTITVTYREVYMLGLGIDAFVYRPTNPETFQMLQEFVQTHGDKQSW